MVGGAAVGPFAAPPGRGVPSWPTAAGLLPDPELAASPDAAPCWRSNGARCMTAAHRARLSLNQRTVKRWSLAEAVDGLRRGRRPAIGLWRRAVAEQGLEDDAASWSRTPGCGCPRCAAAASSPPRPAGPSRRAGRQPPGDRRGRGARRRQPGPGRRRPARRGARRAWTLATWPPRGSGSPRRWPSSPRTPASAGCGSASSRCTRCTAPTGAWCPRSARRSTWPSRSRPSRSASSSTPSTCGGTRRVLEQIARAGGPDRELPGLRLDPRRSPPTRCSARGMMGDGVHRLRPDHPRGRRRRATPGTSRWRSSTPTSGPPTPTGSCPG